MESRSLLMLEHHSICAVDIFGVGGLFLMIDHVIFSRERLFYPSKTYLSMCTWQFQNLKARILKSIITWPEMWQQTVQAKEVWYWLECAVSTVQSCVFPSQINQRVTVDVCSVCDYQSKNQRTCHSASLNFWQFPVICWVVPTRKLHLSQIKLLMLIMRDCRMWFGVGSANDYPLVVLKTWN